MVNHVKQGREGALKKEAVLPRRVPPTGIKKQVTRKKRGSTAYTVLPLFF